MLTFTTEESSSFKFIGMSSTSNSEGGLISDTTSLISNTPSLFTCNDGGLDSCSFYSGPSDSAIMAFGESLETCGSIAYADGETCGSIAYTGGGETCGSVASSFSAGSSFSGGGCNYSC